MMNISAAVIREAQITDAKTICQVIRQAFADVAQRFGINSDNCPKHPSNYTVPWVEDDFQRGVAYYLLEVNHRVLGCAAMEVVGNDLCYLERVAVLPQVRKKGYGRKLADHILKIADVRHIKQVSIGIVADQTDLKQWYRNIGFKEGETKPFEHLPFKVTFMTYMLSSNQT